MFEDAGLASRSTRFTAAIIVEGVLAQLPAAAHMARTNARPNLPGPIGKLNVRGPRGFRFSGPAAWIAHGVHRIDERVDRQLRLIGGEQSPIDLTGAVRAEIEPPTVSWPASGIQCRQQRAHDPGERPARRLRHVGGRRYELQQFHFHTPSEHTLDGKRAAMEAHFVHVGEDGNLMVIGVFLEAGGQDANPAFSSLIAAAPKGEGEAVLNAAIDPASLLPTARHFFRYEGSLTTPPCSEVVEWNVFAAPVAVAQSDIERFKEPFPMNARPLQPVHRRILLTN